MTTKRQRPSAENETDRKRRVRYLYGQCECGGPLLEDGSCESCLLTEEGWRGEYDDLFRGRK